MRLFTYFFSFKKQIVSTLIVFQIISNHCFAIPFNHSFFEHIKRSSYRAWEEMKSIKDSPLTKLIGWGSGSTGLLGLFAIDHKNRREIEAEISAHEKSISDIYEDFRFYQIRHGIFRENILCLENKAIERKGKIEEIREKIKETSNNFKRGFFILPSWVGLKYNKKEIDLLIKSQKYRTNILLDVNTATSFFSTDKFSNVQKKLKEVSDSLNHNERKFSKNSFNEWKAFVLNVQLVSEIMQFIEEPYDLEKYKVILSDMEKSKDLDPKNPFSPLLEIDVLNCSEEEEKIILSKDKLTKIIDNHSYLKNSFMISVIKNFEGINYIREGNLLSAESAFNDSLHRDNTNNIYLTNLAKTLLKKHGNNKNKSNVLSNVEGYLKKSLEIRPSDIEALELMIAVQIYLKNHEEAIKYFEKLFVNSVNEISARKTSKITECILISHLMNLVYIKNINNNELKHVHDLLYKGELTISHKESYLCIYNALHSYSSEINDNKSLLERIPYQFLLFSIGYLLFDPSTWFSSFGNSKPKGSFIFS